MEKGRRTAATPLFVSRTKHIMLSYQYVNHMMWHIKQPLVCAHIPQDRDTVFDRTLHVDDTFIGIQHAFMHHF